MAKFLEGSRINSELERIFKEAKEEIIIVSPFIKFHDRVKDVLRSKIEMPKVTVKILFGKNKDDKSKSLGIDDFEFLKTLPNVEIRHEPRLHAKYYANESEALLSSMNLYEYSQNNNIEFGILVRTSLLGGLTNNAVGDSLDMDAYKYFREDVLNKSSVLYKKAPQYDKGLLGLNKKYTHSEVELNKLSTEFDIRETGAQSRSRKSSGNNESTGYCIRTGVVILFNPKQPFSSEAFKDWNKFKNKDYQEKYCHYSGEPSEGETTFSKPVLRKNWGKAKAQRA
ncbi:MAG: phospholipase D family protein [Tunicatimonas sp.]